MASRSDLALRIDGVVVAAFTPMTPEGALDVARVGPLLDHYERFGVSGVYVTGSTGEGVSLTMTERRQAIDAFVGAGRGRFPVIVQVGRNSLREARELAAHAEAAGADAISSTPPSYFRPTSLSNLVDCMIEVTAGAPGLPFYYYHIPELTGVDSRMVDFLREGGDRLATLAGLKFTSSDLNELQACVELDGGRFEVLSGKDEMLLGALAHGARGAVGSTYNIAAPLYHRLRAAFAAGDIETARRCQSRSIALVDVLRRYRLIPAQKAVMRLIGVDCGPTRLPHVQLTGTQLDSLRRDLDEIGFFEWSGAADAAGGRGRGDATGAPRSSVG